MTKTSNLLLAAFGTLTFTLAACGNSDENSNSNRSTSSVTAPSAATGEESSFIDGVLTTPEVRINITDTKIIPVGQEGNDYGEKPVIAFWYEITNLTDQDIDPLAWIRYFDAYQDNNPSAVNELDVSGLPDDRFLDTQMETIKKDGTVENAMAYELDDDTTPVELVAKQNFLTDSEVGRMTYTIS